MLLMDAELEASEPDAAVEARAIGMGDGADSSVPAGTDGGNGAGSGAGAGAGICASWQAWTGSVAPASCGRGAAPGRERHPPKQDSIAGLAIK
jgi:hypothetical protein